ncbi:hypothetical protein FRC05_003837 [Tulasnella sp. 425]|nr:hypothetical protein FRC05_003837 [Tulasnella sp. 425]
MSSQPSSPINTTSFAAPKTPSASTTSPTIRRIMFSAKSTTSNNSLDTLSPLTCSPFTPFSARDRSASRVSSAFNTPLLLDDLPTTTTLKRAPSTTATASSSSKADFSNNWRAKASPSAGENAPTASPPFLRSPAFVSNDRRLPRALVSQASPSTSTLSSPKHRVSATTATTTGLASPIKYFSPASGTTRVTSRRRAPLFNRSNLEALTAIVDTAAGTKVSEREDVIIEDDPARTAAFISNVHNHHSLLNSSDSDSFIRMDREVLVQPRTLFQDYLSANNANRDVNMMEGVAVRATYCSGCGSGSSNDANFTHTATSSAPPAVTLSYLQPCQHAICHQCFTGMLNIVGEKGLECPMCKGQVTSFDVVNGHHGRDYSYLSPSSPAAPAETSPAYHSPERNFATATAALAKTKSKTPTFASVLNAKMKMKAAALVTADDVFSTSIPSAFASGGDTSSTAAAPTTSTGTTDLPVLRIDNLPWDVTPQMLATWLHPTTPHHIHILLERSTGKTLSHCFVELSTLADARTVLRECQNKIIGSGKRTRAVSVTVSRQEEVMENVFPNWRACFTSTSPSVDGLDARQASEVLKAGLLSYNELDSLLQLMHNPDQDWDSKLLDEVVVAAMKCQAFTDMQRRLISITVNLDSSYPNSSADESSLPDASVASSEVVVTPSPFRQLYVNDLEVPAAVPSSASTMAGRSPWYSQVVNTSQLVSTRPITKHDENSNDSPSPSPLPAGSSSHALPMTYFGRSAPGPTQFHHPQFQPHHQHGSEPQILAPPSPTIAASRNKVNSNTSPRTLFEEIGDDVGVDAELVKMVVKRLFVSQQ